MIERRLHIVSFDVPFPADYGGVIDIFYKLKALYQNDVEIILHIYHYGRGQSKIELSKYCKEIYYYTRKVYKNPFMGTKPYIVSSRNSELLLENLKKDNAPILFEGLHCTYHLDHPSLAKRFKIVRTHNIEHQYYKHLEKSELRYFKKYFFRIEAEKLKKHQRILANANLIAAISPNDKTYFNKKFNNAMYLPAFHSNDTVNYPGSYGNFILYHGNLSVPENYNAAIELVKNVFSNIQTPVIIAGNNPPKELIQLCKPYHHINLKTNISSAEIHELIKDAHINVLQTAQNTGIKLKLINALYLGKYAIVNPLMVDGSGLEELCIVTNRFEEMINQIELTMLKAFDEEHFQHRKDILLRYFSNQSEIIRFIDSIKFPEKFIEYGKKSRANKTFMRLYSFATQLLA